MAALRAERKDAVREFLDAAQLVERIAQHRFNGDPVDSNAAVATHQLWFLQKCIDIVGSPELRGATYEYASRLNAAVWDERPANVKYGEYVNNHRDQFLRAARKELDVPELK